MARVDPGRIRPGRESWGRAGAPVGAILAVLALFAAVLAVRWHSHYANVDDYLYALQTHAYLDGLKSGPHALLDAWRAYGTNAPLLPMLALPLAAISHSPQPLLLVQLVPLLVLAGSARSLMASLGLSRIQAWFATAAIATLAPVLAYAAMFHFALAATACTVLAAAAYARSDRLARLWPALVLGLALGLVSVTRVMAPVYVAALAAPIAIDVLATGPGRLERVRNGAAAAVVGALIAAPWWIANGRAAAHYLRNSGYGQSPFTRHESLLARAGHRLDWTATETGWLLALLILALAVWALVCVVRRSGPPARLLAWLIGTAVLGLALLATSSNLGTAFALPQVVLLACAGAAALAHLPARVRIPALAVSGAVAAVSLLGLLGALGSATLDSRPLWNAGLPGIEQARAAMGCPSCRPPDSERLAGSVLNVIRDRPTLLARDDAVLNANSLRYVASERGSSADLVPAGAGPAVTSTRLAGVDYALTGLTLGPYQPGVDRVALAARLRAARFRPVFTRRLAPWNSVVVWAAPRRRR